MKRRKRKRKGGDKSQTIILRYPSVSLVCSVRADGAATQNSTQIWSDSESLGNGEIKSGVNSELCVESDVDHGIFKLCVQFKLNLKLILTT